MMTKIFVTGASGKVGRALTHRLIDKGYYVVTLVRNKSRFPLEIENLLIVNADILEVNKYKKEINDCDYVYHLAVYQNPADPKIDEFTRVNVEGTRVILDTIKRSKKLKRFFYVSTVMVFEPTGRKPRNENWPKLVSGGGNKYVETKLGALGAVKEYSPRIPIITLYPSIVINLNDITDGNETPSNNWHGWIRKVVGGGVPGVVMSMLGDRDRVMNIVFLDNLVEAMINAMRRGRVGSDYILGGLNITAGDYIHKIEEIKKTKFLPIRIPTLLLRLLALKPPEDICFDSSKAIRDLGLRRSAL